MERDPIPLSILKKVLLSHIQDKRLCFALRNNATFLEGKDFQKSNGFQAYP